MNEFLDEQLNAIDHAQKILRAVKRYDLAALLADGGKGEAVAKPIGYGKKTQLDAIGKNGSALLYSVACPDEDWDVPVYLAAPQAECAPHIETASEHIARDIREGRFPQRSEPQMVATESGVVHPNKEFKDGYQEGHFYGYHEGMKAAEAAGASERADALPNRTYEQGFKAGRYARFESADQYADSAEHADAEKDAALTDEWKLLNEAWDFGQFAEDANWPLSLNVRAAIRAILAANK